MAKRAMSAFVLVESTKARLGYWGRPGEGGVEAGDGLSTELRRSFRETLKRLSGMVLSISMWVVRRSLALTGNKSVRRPT